MKRICSAVLISRLFNEKFNFTIELQKIQVDSYICNQVIIMQYFKHEKIAKILR